jgi:peptidoglycan/LPS O-acetylase OafA/YrhL
MPAYWVCLLLLRLAAPNFLIGGEAQAASSNRTLALALVYMTNWQGVAGENLGVYSHLWSLAIEEQFYFTWAPFLLCLIIMMKSRRSVAGVTLLLNLLLFGWLELGIATHSANLLRTDYRLISLLIGALAGMAYFWKIYPQKFLGSRYFDLLAAASVIAAIVLASRFSLTSITSYRVLPWFALSVAIFIVWCATRTQSVAHHLLTFSPLVWIGQVSYGLYLWHHFFAVYVRDKAWSLPLKLSVGVTASLIVTAYSYYVLERPFLKLKDRLKFKTLAPARFNAATKQPISTINSAKEPLASQDCPVETI